MIIVHAFHNSTTEWFFISFILYMYMFMNIHQWRDLKPFRQTSFCGIQKKYTHIYFNIMLEIHINEFLCGTIMYSSCTTLFLSLVCALCCCNSFKLLYQYVHKQQYSLVHSLIFFYNHRNNLFRPLKFLNK